MCKSSDVFSLAVLIDRGLDLCTKGGIVLGFLGEWLFDVLPLLLSRSPLYSVLRVYPEPPAAFRGGGFLIYLSLDGGGRGLKKALCQHYPRIRGRAGVDK